MTSAPKVESSSEEVVRAMHQIQLRRMRELDSSERANKGILDLDLITRPASVSPECPRTQEKALRVKKMLQGGDEKGLQCLIERYRPTIRRCVAVDPDAPLTCILFSSQDAFLTEFYQVTTRMNKHHRKEKKSVGMDMFHGSLSVLTVAECKTRIVDYVDVPSSFQSLPRNIMVICLVVVDPRKEYRSKNSTFKFMTVDLGREGSVPLPGLPALTWALEDISLARVHESLALSRYFPVPEDLEIGITHIYRTTGYHESRCSIRVIPRWSGLQEHLALLQIPTAGKGLVSGSYHIRWLVDPTEALIENRDHPLKNPFDRLFKTRCIYEADPDKWKANLFEPIDTLLSYWEGAIVLCAPVVIPRHGTAWIPTLMKDKFSAPNDVVDVARAQRTEECAERKRAFEARLRKEEEQATAVTPTCSTVSPEEHKNQGWHASGTGGQKPAGLSSGIRCEPAVRGVRGEPAVPPAIRCEPAVPGLCCEPAVPGIRSEPAVPGIRCEPASPKPPPTTGPPSRVDRNCVNFAEPHVPRTNGEKREARHSRKKKKEKQRKIASSVNLPLPEAPTQEGMPTVVLHPPVTVDTVPLPPRSRRRTFRPSARSSGVHLDVFNASV